MTKTSSANTRCAMICAGGTGGHLFPGQALASVLVERGWQIHLVTDHRVDDLAQDFPAEAMHVVPSATLSLRKPIAAINGGWQLLRGYLAARSLLSRVKPDVVVGFGGYPTLPPVLAASHKSIPRVIHDANAVMGRANRVLARIATRIGTAFPEVRNLPDGLQDRIQQVGIPVRGAVLEAAKQAYDSPIEGGPIRLVVFGGSQGARIMREVVPVALSALPEDLRRRLKVAQQARPEDSDAVSHIYREAHIAAEIAPFFGDLPKRIANAHLVISRSGASTVAELSVIGRPSILVPLPGALDQDQLHNAQALEAAGGAVAMVQDDFTPAGLLAEVQAFADNPKRLTKMAEAAKAFGKPDAAHRLADLVESVSSTDPVR